MKKIIVIFLLIVCSGCSFISFPKSTYTDRVPRVPQKQTMSAESTAALAKAGTEINKGLADIKTLSEYANLIPKDEVIDILGRSRTRFRALYDYSYVILDFFGAIISDTDWDNPEEFFADIEKTKEELKKAQAEKRQIEEQYQKDMKKFHQDLLEMQGDLEKKEGELNKKKTLINRIIGWIWKTALIIGLIIAGIFAAEHITGIPIMSMVFGGARVLRKGMKGTIHAIHEFREQVDNEKVLMNAQEAQAMKRAEQILLEKLRDKHDNKIEKMVKKELSKNKK